MADSRSFLAGVVQWLSAVPLIGYRFDRVMDHTVVALTITSGGSEGDTLTADIKDNADTPATDTIFLQGSGDGTRGWLFGMGVTWVQPADNTGAMTLSVNGGPPYPVLSSAGVAIQPGQVTGGMVVVGRFNGGSFYITSAIGEGDAGPAARYWQEFTADGTWTKPDGLGDDTPVRVRAWGGGGGGNVTGGGGGASYAEIVLRLGDLPNSVAVTVGEGGTTSFSSGGNGGNSTFGSYLTAFGGGGASSTAPDGGGGAGLLSAGSGATAGTLGGGVSPGGSATLPEAGGAGGDDAPSTRDGGASVYGGGGGGGNGGDGGASTYGGGGGDDNVAGESPGGGGGSSAEGGPGLVQVII